MTLTKIAAATAAASLALSPVVAQAQPATAPVADASELGGEPGISRLILLALVAAAIIGGILIFNDDDDDGDSVSI